MTTRIVLLRGLTRESRHWGDFPERLRTAAEDREVVTLDLPGNGVMNAQPSPLSVEAMADACRAELRRRGLPPPYHLLAMSLGAMVALAWADGHPDELQSCILVNTSLRGLSPWYERLQPRCYARLFALMVSRDDRSIERVILELTTHHPPMPVAALLDRWVRWRRENPVSRRNATRQLWAAMRFRAPHVAPRVPLLILASTLDELVSSTCSTQLAHTWHAALRMHPSAGHDLPLDDGPWVAREVNDWLDALRQTG